MGAIVKFCYNLYFPLFPIDALEQGIAGDMRGQLALALVLFNAGCQYLSS
jgi:hypothetical protein